MGLDVTTERHDGMTVAVLSGELDIYTVAGFKQNLDDIDPASELLVIDLSDVGLLDSSGLGALVSMLNQARAGDRPLGIVCPHRRLRRVFEITGLRRAFVFGDDLDAVRGALADGDD